MANFGHQCLVVGTDYRLQILASMFPKHGNMNENTEYLFCESNVNKSISILYVAIRNGTRRNLQVWSEWCFPNVVGRIVACDIFSFFKPCEFWSVKCANDSCVSSKATIVGAFTWVPTIKFGGLIKNFNSKKVSKWVYILHILSHYSWRPSAPPSKHGSSLFLHHAPPPCPPSQRAVLAAFLRSDSAYLFVHYCRLTDAAGGSVAVSPAKSAPPWTPSEPAARASVAAQRVSQPLQMHSSHCLSYLPCSFGCALGGKLLTISEHNSYYTELYTVLYMNGP
jgi:hypothetical protein